MVLAISSPGPDLTAEQVHNWLVQNGVPPNGATPGNAANNQQDLNAGWGVWPAP